MAVATWSDLRAAEVLSRRPDFVWMRDGIAMFGWGRHTSVDPGAGSGQSGGEEAHQKESRQGSGEQDEGHSQKITASPSRKSAVPLRGASSNHS